MRSRNPWLWAGISALIVLVLYAPACVFPFVYDDVGQIVENRELSSWSFWWTSSVAFDTDYLPYPGRFYRPVFWTSLAANHALFGLDPAGYHFTNLFFHWLCGLLLFRLLSELKPEIAWPTALLWLVLPVHTEVVAWVSGRAMALSALGVLAGLCFPRFVVPCQIGALLAHEAGLVLAPLSYLIRGRSTALQAAAAFVVYAGARMMVAPPQTAFRPEQLLQGPLALWRTLQWTVLPWNLSMERSSDWAGAPLWQTAIGWALLAGALWVGRRHRLILWSPLALLPFSGLLPLYQGFAERYCYLASIGVVGLLAVLWNRSSRPLRAAGLVIVAAMALRTAARVQDWRDEPTLYQASLAASPRSHVLRYNLGVLAKGTTEARQWYESAIRLNPNYLAAKVNLANVVQREGDDVRARQLYREVLSAEPLRTDALVNLGNLEQRQGRAGEAETMYRRALAINSTDQTAQLNLAALLLRAGRAPEAGELLRGLISTSPDHAQAHANLGALYFQSNDLPRARYHLERAAAILPDDASVWFNLGVLHETLADPKRAAECFRRALSLDPQHSGAAERLGQMRNQ